MLRLPLNSLGTLLQQFTFSLQHKSSVCSSCLAIANLRRKQPQQPTNHHPEQHQLQLPHYSSQQRRRLQLYTPKYNVPQKGFAYPSDWTYGGKANGEKTWGHHFPSCDGISQSPIDLPDSSDVVRDDAALGDFTFTSFDTVKDIKMVLVNSGHAAQVTYLQGNLTVSGGNLPGTFKVAQFHFHWGSNNKKGSEHTVMGHQYPMEMHVVTHNTKYADLSDALDYKDGLAVLGVFFDIDTIASQEYCGLISALKQVRLPGQQLELTPIPLSTLLPSNLKQYWRYHGSLTTPPCTEVVTWTLFRQPITVSKGQMKQFRNLESGEVDEKSGKTLQLVNNYRSTQKLGDRNVKNNFDY